MFENLAGILDLLGLVVVVEHQVVEVVVEAKHASKMEALLEFIV